MSVIVHADVKKSGIFLDASSKAQGLSFSTNEHGFASCSFFYPCSLQEAFRIYDRPGLPHVEVNWNGMTVWEGRLEDVAITGDGVRLTALGYWRAMSDVPYTGFWSLTETRDFRPVLESDASTFNPKNWQFDTQDRLNISVPKSACMRNNSDAGGLHYRVPHGSTACVAYISACYGYDLNTNWTVRITGQSDTFGSNVSTNISTAGGAACGIVSVDISGSPRAIVNFHVFNSSGGSSLNSAESGSHFATFTQLRLTTVASPVYANAIASGLIAFVNSINGSQIANSNALLTSTGVDLFDEVYQDEYPADILERLALRGDSASKLYEVGVWEGRVLFFRQRGSAGRTFYADIAEPNIERTIDELRNSAYAVYRSPGGQTYRTSACTDTVSSNRYGIIRRQAVRATTTASAQAISQRDAFLTDRKDPTPRVGLEFRELYDGSGARWPGFVLRSGDTLVIRNLPPTLGSEVDRIRSFRVKETTYDADQDIVRPVPELPPSTLAAMVAREQNERG